MRHPLAQTLAVTAMSKIANIPHENRLLQAKYKITSLFYDILDYPWERQYRKWRPELLKGVKGSVIEAGVGTGHNLKHYHSHANVFGVDLINERGFGPQQGGVALRIPVIVQPLPDLSSGDIAELIDIGDLTALISYLYIPPNPEPLGSATIRCRALWIGSLSAW